MASIIVNHNMAGLTAQAARSTLKSASWKREDVEFRDPMLNTLNIPAKSDIALVITQLAQQAGSAGGFTIANNTNDYLEQWEKTFAVNKLALNDQWNVDARDTTARYGDPKEWDSFVLSVDQSVSDTELATIRDIAVDELTSPSVLGFNNATGQTIPFKGMNGRRAIFISEQHDNTGVRHLHILVNRHAFDMQGKEVAKAVDFSRSGVVQTVMDQIEARIRQAGITHSFGAITAKSQAVTQNTLQMQAQANTNQQIAQAGGQAPGTSAQVGVTVPVSPGKTMVVAAPLTPDAVGMKQQSDVLKNEAERKFREIERLTAEAQAAVEAASKVDQAIQALADNEVLRSTLEETQAELELANAKGVTLEEANTDLSEKLDAAETARQIQHEALVGIGTELSEKAAVLGIDDEQAQDLATGNVVAIGTMVESLGKQVGTWNEAVDQLPEEMADALRDDPFKGLNALVDELLDKRAETTKLTAQNEALQGQLTASNTLNAELQSKVATTESDLENVKALLAQKEAEFEAKMAEQVKKVAEAEANVARAEGAVAAKQEQLVAEQAKVEKLARTQAALMGVLTSENAGQAWEQNKDLFKDDVFAERAMKAYLLTSANLDASKQKVADLEKVVADYAEVKKNLADVQAVVEENLVLVNDAGVADLRTLVQQHKALTAGNATLNQQIADLAQAAQTANEATEKAQAELAKAKEQLAQKSEQPQVDYQRKAVLDLFEKDPAFAALVVEAAGSDSVRAALLAIANDADTGMTPEGGQAPGQASADYTKGLEDEKKGPGQGGPDQNI